MSISKDWVDREIAVKEWRAKPMGRRELDPVPIAARDNRDDIARAYVDRTIGRVAKRIGVIRSRLPWSLNVRTVTVSTGGLEPEELGLLESEIDALNDPLGQSRRVYWLRWEVTEPEEEPERAERELLPPPVTANAAAAAASESEPAPAGPPRVCALVVDVSHKLRRWHRERGPGIAAKIPEPPARTPVVLCCDHGWDD